MIARISDAIQKRLETTFLDYLLVAVCNALSLYSGAMALSVVRNGYFFVGLSILGTLLSCAMRNQFLTSKYADAPSYAFGASIAIALYGMDGLISIVPEPVYRGPIFAVGLLSWFLVVTSFFAWREGTMLFLLVPSLAIFGLIGSYDTYPNTAFTFFGFLLCSATLFARAHARSMLRQAISSGYTNLDQIDRGPWRWVAGPQWALGSAFVVVMLSYISAPTIQKSAESVSGQVKVDITGALAKNLSTAAPSTASIGQAPTAEAPVGGGPRGSISNKLVLRAKLDQPRYLRSATYREYTKGGWRRRSNFLMGDSDRGGFGGGDFGPFQGGLGMSNPRWQRRRDALDYDLHMLKNPTTVQFRIEMIEPMPMIPAPGMVTKMESEDVQAGVDGTVLDEKGMSSSKPYAGEFIEADPNIVPQNSMASSAEMPDFWRSGTDASLATERVRAFVNKAIVGAKTDYDKAFRVKEAIEKQAKYNLQAKAVPTDKDAVDYFLFESKEGYCDLFASAMTLCARVAGIPSRYAVGYYPIHEEKDDQGYLIRESEAHAWAELYFQDVGWIAFDATEGAAGVGDAIEQKQPFFTPAMIQTLITGAINGVIVLFVAFVLWYIWRNRPHRVVRHPLAKEYLLFMKTLEQACGRRWQLHQTPYEYLDFAAPSLGPTYDEARILAERFSNAFYSKDAGKSETGLMDAVKLFRRHWKEFKHNPPTKAVVQIEEQVEAPVATRS